MAGEGHARRARAAGRRAGRRARGEGHAAPRRRPVRRRRRRRETDAALPRQGDRRCPDGTLLVSDSAHHSLVELAADGETRASGASAPASAAGRRTARRAAVHRAAGLVPAARRRRGRGRLRRGRRRHRQPRAARRRPRRPARSPRSPAPASSGGRRRRPTARADAIDLSSPVGRRLVRAAGVVVAMAGIHQLWLFDPATGTVERARRHHRRGPARRPAATEAWFAQPSGLAAADGDRLWLADSETSALRWVDATAQPCTPPSAGAVRLRPPRRPRRPGAAPAPARRHRRCPTARSPSPTPTTARSAATTRRPARCPRWPRIWPSRATSVLGRRRAWSSSSPPRTGSNARSRRGATAGQRRRRHRHAAPPSTDSRRARSSSTWSSPRRRARSWTTATARPPGWRSPRPRPGCCWRARASARTWSASWCSTDGVHRGRAARRRAGRDLTTTRRRAPGLPPDPQDWGVPVRVVKDGPRRLPLMMGGLDDGI